MKPFQYATALSPERAVELAGQDGRFFAGGIDVLGEMKNGLAEPDVLVNVKELPETHEITRGGDAWTIGTNVRLVELETDERVRSILPALAEAAREVGSPQIRNVATVGGNLAQHSRCWYYRHKDITCLKNGGDTCFARIGKNRHHSLFSGNPCISPVVSNLSVALTALDAEAVVVGDDGERRMTMAELYENAWVNSLAHNSLGPQDLILRVDVPLARNRSSYLQVSEKERFDWALVSAAAAARVEGRTLHEPRVVLGVVAPVPYMVEEANALLDGRELTEALAEEAAEVLLDDARPRTYNGYKVPLAKALAKRALMNLVA